MQFSRAVWAGDSAGTVLSRLTVGLWRAVWGAGAGAVLGCWRFSLSGVYAGVAYFWVFLETVAFLIPITVKSIFTLI